MNVSDDRRDRTRMRYLKGTRGRAVYFVKDVLGEDPTEWDTTFSPEQFRQCLAVLDMPIKRFARLFRLSPTRIQRWLTEEEAIPVGYSDYLRRRVAAKINAIAHVAGVGVVTDYDDEDPPQTPRAMSAAEGLLHDREKVRQENDDTTEAVSDPGVQDPEAIHGEGP